MPYSSSDLKILAISTGRIYWTSVVDAFHGLKINWWVPLFHISYVIVFILAAIVLSPFGIVGGFIMGLVLAALLASYLSTVESGVQKENFLLREAWRDMGQLFSPVISVLFSLYILGIVVQMALPKPEQRWLVAALNAVLMVMFSPAPEVIYMRRSHAVDIFSQCLEFIKENLLEWYFLWVVFFALLALYSPVLVQAVILGVLGTPPLRFFTTLLILGQDLLQNPMANGLVGLVICYVTYFVFLFRGNLYQQLSQSSRRKRIYQARMY